MGCINPCHGNFAERIYPGENASESPFETNLRLKSAGIIPVPTTAIKETAAKFGESGGRSSVSHEILGTGEPP